jgi:hypothetical protein
MLIDFRLPHSIHRRSANPGSVALCVRKRCAPGYRAVVPQWGGSRISGLMWWEAERHIGRAAGHGRSGSFRLPFWGRIGSKLQHKIPRSTASRSDLRTRGKPGSGALACSATSMSGSAGARPAWAASDQFCEWEAPSIGACGLLGPCRGLNRNVYGVSNLHKQKTRPARPKVEAPAMSWVGISVRNTRHPEARAGGTGASVLSPSCARGDHGDKTRPSSASRSAS